MKKNSFIKILICAIITLSLGISAFAQDQRPDFNSINGPSGCDSQEDVSLQDKISGFFHNIFKPKPNIQQLRQEARIYRQKAIVLQKESTSDSIEKAVIVLEQALELDPYYADAYNDLGIIYEAKGSVSIAEQYYLKAIEVNPDYLNSYSNLALLYEGQGGLKQAYYYWQIRAQYGNSDDEWAKKARLRVETIRNSVPELKEQYLAEIAQQMSLELHEELEAQKKAQRLSREKEVKECLDSAVVYYKKAQYQQSVDEFEKALSLDPSLQNSNKIKLMAAAKEKINSKLNKELEKKKREEKRKTDTKVKAYIHAAVVYYKRGQYQQSVDEFEKALSLDPSLQNNSKIKLMAAAQKKMKAQKMQSASPRGI